MSSEIAASFPKALVTTTKSQDSTGGSSTIALKQLKMPADSEKEVNCTSDKEERSDEKLLQQVGLGQSDALASLFRRHARSIRNVARRILRQDDEADELLQDVFLYISRKAALFEPSQGSARSWIYHVTYHRAFDRRRYLILRHFYDSHNLNDSVIRDRGRYNESMFNYLAAGNLMDKFEDHLSPEQQETIHLYFVEGYSLREIAEKTGQTLGNVRNHYYRGLERLRSHILKEKVPAK